MLWFKDRSVGYAPKRVAVWSPNRAVWPWVSTGWAGATTGYLKKDGLISNPINKMLWCIPLTLMSANILMTAFMAHKIW